MPHVYNALFIPVVDYLGLKYPFVKRNSTTFTQIFTQEFNTYSVYHKLCQQFFSKFTRQSWNIQTPTEADIKTIIDTICVNNLYPFKVFYENDYKSFDFIAEAIVFYDIDYSKLKDLHPMIHQNLRLVDYIGGRIKNNPIFFTAVSSIIDKFLVFALGALSHKIKHFVDKSYLTTDSSCITATGLLGTLYNTDAKVTVFNCLKNTDPTDIMNDQLDNAQSYTISSFANSLAHNPLYNDGIVIVASIENCKKFCQTIHEKYRPIYIKLHSMSSSEFQHYIKSHPDLHCLFGKYMTKTSRLRNTLMACLDRNMSYYMYPILINSLKSLNKTGDSDEVTRPQFVIPTAKKLKTIRVIEI